MTTMLPRDLLARLFDSDPRAIAAFEQLDQYLNQTVTDLVTQLLSSADDANSRIGGLEAKDLQPHSTLLDAIAALPDDSGAIEITGPDEVHARPIDGTDLASLLSRGVADSLYSPKSTVGVTDGDKGDIVVSGSGAAWNFDPGVVTTFARTILDDADAATVRSTLGLTYFATGTDAANLTGTLAAGRLPAFSGDVVSSAGSAVLTIGANAVTFSKFVAATGAGFVGALGAGNFGQITGTQATALLDTFTSALKGLVPASGGGTTNFLRADGTWVAPTAGAAGSDRQVQYNNGGALAGSAAIDIDADGNLRADYAASLTTPGADQITFAPQRIAASGGIVLPRFLSEDGIKWTMQPHFGRNSVCGEFLVGNVASGVTSFNISALTNAGTATIRSVATTNRLTRAKRMAFVSAATAGSHAGRFNAAANTQWTVGGASGAGLKATFRWGVSDASAVAGAHMLIGMRASTAAPSVTTNPNTLTNVIGVAQCNGSTNLFLVYGGSAAQTVIDLGASFPAADSSALYELILYARPDDATKVAYRVENIGTGAVASGVLAGTAGTALPAVTTLLGPILWRSNNATALAVGLDIVSWVIESDI